MHSASRVDMPSGTRGRTDEQVRLVVFLMGQTGTFGGRKDSEIIVKRVNWRLLTTCFKKPISKRSLTQFFKEEKMGLYYGRGHIWRD
jgi:hypothetical protein